MLFFKQYILPVLVLLLFLVALVAVSARSFLPSGLAEPVSMIQLSVISYQLPVNRQ